MQYRALIVTATIALVAGCSRPEPSTPAEQGEALLNAGSYDEAIVKLGEAIRLNPRDPAGYLHRGRAYQCREKPGDLDAAIADLTTAISLAPDDPEPLYSRAIAYRDRGRSTGSEEDDELARADQAAARERDPGIAINLATMPETDTPLELDSRRLPGDAGLSAPAVETQPVESAEDIRRRIESEAAAAGRSDQRGDPRADESSAGDALTFPSAADRQRRTEGKARSQYDRNKARDDELMRQARERFRATRQGDQTGLPEFDAANGASTPSAANPLAGSPSLPGTAMTPGANQAPRRSLGGTLPPVGNAPFSTPAPYQVPPTGAGTSALPNGSQYQPLPQSPFSSRTPQPTGRMPQQQPLFVPGPAQPRSLYSPYPRRTNHPPTVEHFDFNP